MASLTARGRDEDSCRIPQACEAKCDVGRVREDGLAGGGVRGTLQDHVYRQLCELILNGEIAPGQLMTIQALADAFGVSAMPVREALQRLIAARALTVISSRSIGVPHLTRASALDLRRVRLEVESLAATGRCRTSATPRSAAWRRA